MKKAASLLIILAFTLCICAQNRSELCVGNVNYVRTNTINGGNYLFLRYGYQLLPNFTFKCDLATDVVPEHFDDLLTSAHLSYNTNSETSPYSAGISLFYMANFGEGFQPDHYAGSRISILGFTTDDNNVRVELLPFSVMYDITGKTIFSSYEFIDVTFLF
ncbi:MAG: hypothetical protein ACLFVQ_12055 [Chitinispirillaceae bacterium]